MYGIRQGSVLIRTLQRNRTNYMYERDRDVEVYYGNCLMRFMEVKKSHYLLSVGSKTRNAGGVI